jgi:DNA-binding CsgD family transcriptional regulator
MGGEIPKSLGAGYDTLSQGRWDEASAFFEQAVREDETAEALEGLATAAWWRDDVATAFMAREQAYGRYRQRGDRRGAGRMAMQLGVDHCSLRDAYESAMGWLNRANVLLAGLEHDREHAWLALWEGHLELSARHDVATARRHSARAAGLARSLGLRDLEALAVAQEGLARLSDGDSSGRCRLDQLALVTFGADPEDLQLVVAAGWMLLCACEQLGAFDCSNRLALIEDAREPWSSSRMFLLCRTQCAALLTLRGAWFEAETQLDEARRSVKATRPDIAAEVLVRLAALRRRQGRRQEALDLLDEADAQPLRVLAERQGLLVRAELALDGADALSATAHIERALRSIPTAHHTARLAGLELLVHAQLALREQGGARGALAELQRAAANLATDAARARVRLAEAAVAAADDVETAPWRFEETLLLFERSEAPFDAARARLDLAAVLTRLGRSDAAVREATCALDALQTLGASREAERADALLCQLVEGAGSKLSRPPDGPLTRREIDVLCLVAQGHCNDAIAADLVVSVRTVERHLSNIYQKVGVSGRAARAAAVAYALQTALLPDAPPYV